ncbi:SAVED domain-containing protein [Magnetovibrio sp. PR-2]|uniref:SAVED domain-containing protein n=1 Tax=Magnetovibrio sp. PR-2 TaxID=3120356 RepID=UPI002FCE2427
MSNNKVSLRWILEQAFEVLKVRASVEGKLISVGGVIFCGAGVAAIVRLAIPTQYGSLVFDYLPEGGSSLWGMLFGAALILSGLAVGVYKIQNEQRLNERHRILAIELRGLQDTSDTPLASFLPSHIKGRKDTLLIDIRKFMHNGTVTNPQAALDRVNLITHDFNEWRRDIDRGDVSAYLGGLMPVPFSFLAGMLLDDEHMVNGMLDWDRDKSSWRELDEEDDGNRFLIKGLGSIPQRSNEVIVAISASYSIDIEGVKNFKHNTPIVELELANRSTSCHWSESKQQALSAQLREVLVTLSDKHIELIHLFIAGANSLVIRLGRTYDRRNMPRCNIYQYERSATPPYPWGVVLPTHGVNTATII